MAPPRVAFYDDPAYREHDSGPGHPERPERLEAFVGGLRKEGLLERLIGRRALYVSSPAFPFYPGTGALGEVGEGPGRGFTVNLPMPQGFGDQEYARVYRTIVEPIGRAFDPELVLVSAGFDAHRGDPLAGMDLTREGYAELTDVCLGIAAGSAKGRGVAAFEGGYNLDAIAGAAAAVARGLLGEVHTRQD